MAEEIEIESPVFVDKAVVGNRNSILIIQLCITVFVVLLSLIYYIRHKYVRANTFLITGLSDSGKTLLFLRLLKNNEINLRTCTSLQENRCDNVKLDANGRYVSLIDFPGSDKLRKQCFTNYLQKDRKTLRGIVFVIDSATFSKRVRDVSAFLYDIFYETEKKIPVCIACNKQDLSFAKSAQAVRTALEREFGMINGTREAALDTTDGQNKKRTLTNNGKCFEWSNLSVPIEFIECSATGSGDYIGDVESLKKWVVST